MRRLLAIALLIAFFAPFAAPPLAALTADPEANLPLCCRSHGAHHCVMVHWMLQHADSDPPSLAPGQCAQFPLTAAVPQLAAFTLSIAPQLLAQPAQVSELSAATALRAQLLLARTRRDRGPPADFA